ncbi:MAG: hypothetical protein AMK72_02880 [Planctomycetes bacterium SM23_25]|nr:MAG: hypothetical protein AMS14_03120 [Planctomycetes bacterium DG_20]KPK50162.1 MAG: hypothetical protein AMK72_02880 [Planctomycetes bacterium SM23_25]
MRTMTSRTIRLATFLLAAAALMTFAAASDGITLKHKKTGEVIQGTLLSQKINNLRVFRIHGGGTRFIDLDEWKVIEADEPAAKPDTPTPDTPTPAEPKPDAPAPPAPPAAADKQVYIITISGPILEHCLPEAIDRALKEAKVRKAGVVVFRLDTPGGYVRIADEIIQCIEGVDWATTVSWVEGGERQALSAGAYICLSTHKIFMAPGTTMGAATPYHVTRDGSPEVDEKFRSAFRAKFRSLAERRGHSPVIADAMVDQSLSAVQVWLDGQQMIVTEDDAKRLTDEHGQDKRFKRGKIIAMEGKLLTLTSTEAVEFKVACGIAATQDELLKQLGCDGAKVATAHWLPPWVKETDEKRSKTVETQRTLFTHYFKQAVREDPHAQTYYVSQSRRTFLDGGESWREHTDRCLAHLKKCAAALTELEKLSKDKRYGFAISEESLNEMKLDMETTYKRLLSERNTTRLP